MDNCDTNLRPAMRFGLVGGEPQIGAEPRKVGQSAWSIFAMEYQNRKVFYANTAHIGMSVQHVHTTRQWFLMS